MANAVIRRVDSNQWRSTNTGKILIFPRNTGKKVDFHGFYELGDLEAIIWKALEKPVTFDALSASVSAELAVMGDVEMPTPEELMAELQGFIEDMAANGLVEIC